MRVIADGHCDTIEVAYDKKKSINNLQFKFNLQEVRKPIIQMMAIFIHPKYKESFERTKNMIEYFYKQKEQFSNEIYLIKERQEIDKVIKENKIGTILTIENGRAIENNLDNIDYLYKKGIRMMSINWNEDNLLGSGSATKNDKGLTNFGKEYIKKLNSKNIIVDISHSSTKTFWDAVKTSEKTIVASHSCCRTLCRHLRNLDDEQIKQIAKRKGIIGICYCAPFLSETGIASTEDVVKHIAHIVNLTGIDYVGLGSDFDGVEKKHMVINLTGINQINNLVEELRKFGFHEKEISKIMGENWIRLLKEL